MLESEIDRRIDTLAEYLNISPAEVEYLGEAKEYPSASDEYETPEGTYYVVTDAEAYDLTFERLVDDLEDSPMEYFGIDFLYDYIDGDWFEECCREDCEFLASDYSNAELIQECLDAGIIDEEDIDEDDEYTGDLDLESEYADYLFEVHESDYGGDFVEWYVDNFGRDSINHLIRQGDISIDSEAAAQDVINSDGYMRLGDYEEYGGYIIVEV